MNGVLMVEKEDCNHIFASKILTDMTKEKDLDLNEKDQVFIVETKPSFVAVVYPKTKRCDSKGAQARPGVIQKHQKCQNIGVAHAKEERVAIIWSSSISPKMKTQK